MGFVDFMQIKVLPENPQDTEGLDCAQVLAGRASPVYRDYWVQLDGEAGWQVAFSYALHI